MASTLSSSIFCLGALLILVSASQARRIPARNTEISREDSSSEEKHVKLWDLMRKQEEQFSRQHSVRNSEENQENIPTQRQGLEVYPMGLYTSQEQENRRQSPQRNTKIYHVHDSDVFEGGRQKSNVMRPRNYQNQAEDQQRRDENVWANVIERH